MKEKEYESLVRKLAEEFDKSIPESEKELTDNFVTYLYSAISNLESKGQSKDEIERKIGAYARYIIGRDLEEKKREIVIDNAFEKIRQISNEFFRMAKGVLVGEQVDSNDDFSQKIEEMKELLCRVTKYNRQQAENLISEAILDVGFITNSQSGITSVRIAHETRRKKQEEKNMKGEER